MNRRALKIVWTVFGWAVAGLFSPWVSVSGHAAVLPKSVVPVAQSADANSWWQKRHATRLQMVTNLPQVVFVGDSITHFWENKPSWRVYWRGEPCRALNLGYCSDRTENVLWRIDHGELDGYSAKVIVLMIGTNNAGTSPFEEEPPMDTLLGIRAILKRIREKQPQAHIVLMPIFPRGERRDDPVRLRNDTVNRELARFADGRHVVWCDFTDRLLDAEGDVPVELFPDYLHPSIRGYEIWAGAVQPLVDRLLSAKSGAAVASIWPTAPRKYRSARALAEVSEGPDVEVDAEEWWTRCLRHRSDILGGRGAYDVVFVGGTVMDYLETTGRSVLNEWCKTYSVLNLSCRGDLTRQQLWRLENGALEGYKARLVVLQIGTNNMLYRPADNIAAIRRMVDVVRARQSDATVLLLPVCQRMHENDASLHRRNAEVNAAIRKMADGARVRWIDFNAKYRTADGDLDRAYWVNFEIPTPKAFRVLQDDLKPILREICGK